MAHFMVPRFVRVLEELPKTPSQKVQKHVLRAQGAAGAWDRTEHMDALRRDRLA
jgi:carnitine-CoA ligase